LLSGRVEVEVSPELIEEVQRKNGKAFLFATCKECGKQWNISRLQKVPESGYICPHCRSKAQQKRQEITKRVTYTALKYVLLAVLGVLLYLHTAEAAEIQRGYKAYGGECVFLLLPLWWFFIEVTVKNTEAALRSEEVKPNV